MDLAGVAGGRPVRYRNSGQKRYHWKTLRARAQDTAGDQRINSFGIGGEIEIRSGLLTQKQVITSPLLHFGLGENTQTDVARIVSEVRDALNIEPRAAGAWLAMGSTVLMWRHGRLVLTVTYSDAPGLDRPDTVSAIAQLVDSRAAQLNVP